MPGRPGEATRPKRGIPLDMPWRDAHRGAAPLGDRRRRRLGELEEVRQDTGTACSASSPGSRPRPTRCTSACCCRATAAYTPCTACDGARLKPESLLWRVGTKDDADAVLTPAQRHLPKGAEWTREQLGQLAGLSIHDLMLLPVDRAARFFARLELPAPLDEATELLLAEIRARLGYLGEVGLGYLTLDRQSRTLSGGEVQRINLTTALGTSLVNTLFVLDEPSIGLHPRDMGRVIGVMQRLRDAGNSLVVVEHDPQIMLAADRVLDMGPGAGERGGEIVFFGTPEALKRRAHRSPASTSRAQARRRAHSRRRGAPPRHRGPQRPRARSTARHGMPGRARGKRAQPQAYRRRLPAAPAGVRHRRVGVGQVHADPGRAATRRCCKHRQADRSARRASTRLAGAERVERRGDGGPVAHRPHHALEPGQLRGRVRRDPRAVRRGAGGEGARVHAPAPSASTPATGAAPPAAATASSTSRCSSSPTCTCAARTATARATATRCWR